MKVQGVKALINNNLNIIISLLIIISTIILTFKPIKHP